MTLKSIELLQQEKDALNALCGALINLSNIRHQQTEEEKKTAQVYMDDGARCDTMLDQLHSRLDAVMVKHGIEYGYGKTQADAIEARLDELQPALAGETKR